MVSIEMVALESQVWSHQLEFIAIKLKQIWNRQISIALLNILF